MSVVCPLCERELRPGEGAAAFRGRMAHIACWLEWREGRGDAPRPTVLVVEDDEATLYATRRVLESGGLTVVAAKDAKGALEALTHRPDLVLLDLQLPDLDGIEVCRRIKSDPTTAFIRVLPYTAVFKTDVDRRRAFEAGADGYLVKPLAPEQLVATVQALIGPR